MDIILLYHYGVFVLSAYSDKGNVAYCVGDFGYLCIIRGSDNCQKKEIVNEAGKKSVFAVISFKNSHMFFDLCGCNDSMCFDYNTV